MNDTLGWQNAGPLAAANSATGLVHACSRRPDQLDVFWTAPDGSVAIRSWFEGPGWQDAGSLAPAGSATGRVDACSRRPDQLDVFWTAPDGSVAIRSWFDGPGWQTPWPLAAAGSAVAGSITSCSRRSDQLDVFWVAADSTVMIRSWFEGDGWQTPWPLAPAGSATGRVDACSRRPDQLDVFWTAQDGSVAIRSWFDGPGWQTPWPLAAAGSAVAGSITSCSRRSDQLDVFWVAADSTVMIRSWFEGDGWQTPWPLAPAGSATGTVDACSRRPDQLDVFWTAQDGTVMIRSWFGPSFIEEARTRIRAKWHQTGGAAGPLSLMTGAEQVAGTSVIQQFRGGSISTQDASTTALIERRVRLLYVGMHCFGETSGPGDDEMYAVISVVPPDRGDAFHITQKVPDPGGNGTIDMNDGSTSTDGFTELWSGPPQDVVVSVSLFEHDNSVPSQMKDLVDSLIIGGITAAGAAIGGPVGAFVGGGGAAFLVPRLTEFVAEDILGLSDDVINNVTFALFYNELVGTPPQKRQLDTITYTHETPLISDGDASYKLYFLLTREDVHHEV